MKIFTLKHVLMAAGLAACGTALSAQSTAISSTPLTPPVKTEVPTAIQAAIDNFSAKRDALIAARKAVLDQLKTATPEQGQAIIDKLRADAKDLVAQQKALAKDIRDKLRDLRKTAPTSGGGG